MKICKVCKEKIQKNDKYFRPPSGGFIHRNCNNPDGTEMNTMILRLSNSPTIPNEEIASKEFFQGMINRMIVSHHKYHQRPFKKLSEYYKAEEFDEINALGNARIRLKLYRQTGNREWLMDAANCIMIEYMFPSHKKAHFRPTRSEESPGIRKEKR